ncbi:hypothetical protein BH20ACT10_BH20ACT10_03990 [soil metagenome]|jgi:pyruvate dehydrogenase E1 component
MSASAIEGSGEEVEDLLHALSRLGEPDGTSSYLRLSTRPVAQNLANVPKDEKARNFRRKNVHSGGYRLRDSSDDHGLSPSVALVGAGAVMPEVIRAAELLEEEGGIGADVICLTSYDLVFRALRARQGLDENGEYSILETLFPESRKLPIVSVIDGHPHSLAFLGGIQTVGQTCLGVADFGQSGDVDDLYEHYGIDAETIIGAALDAIG